MKRQTPDNDPTEPTLEELYRHSQSLLRLSRVLERAESYDEVAKITQEEVRATIGYSSVWIYLLSDDCTYASLLAVDGSVSDSDVIDERSTRLTIPGDPMMEEIVAATDIVVVEDGRTDPRTNKEIVAQLGNRTIINVPIIFSNRHLGIIGTGTFGDEGIRIPTESERSYLSAMASHLAVTLDRIRLLIERRRTEQELRRYKDHLEDTVQQRTAELLLARDAAEAANRAKSVFLANMSHELRTPLNAILGFSRMMSGDPELSEDLREILDIINRSGEHLLRLINDVLEMAQIEAGRLQLEVSPLSLGGLVRDVVELMQIRCREKGLELRLDQSSKFPLCIKGDEGRLRQILLNLLGNAVKFTECGGVTVRLGVREDANTHLLIEVQDTGPGIRAEDQKRIFEPFLQLTDDASRHGTGLGLAITHQFVQMMGGNISVESTPGHGALFRVDLPLEAVDEDDLAWLESERPGRVIGLEPGQPALRVLIAEDQRDNQLLLSRLMTNLGFEVRIAENGEECIQLFEQWPPDLIWMDRRMPRMDGGEATRRIRQLPGGDAVKIIAVTASAFAEQRQELLDAGMDDLITKPYRFEEVYDCMARHLGLRYRYADDAETQPAAPLTPALLSAVDPELLEQLQIAVESLERNRIADVVDKIGAAHAEVGKTLSDLTEQFAYPAILDALRALEAPDA